VINTRVGSAELECLAELLATPCQLGDYRLEGLIRRTTTALVFVARGGEFGEGEGVVKVTGREYAPVLERELGLLVFCQANEVGGVVRPLRPSLAWFAPGGDQGTAAAAMLLPFLRGGDLIGWIGAQASRTGRLGPGLALEVGLNVATILRALLRLPRPVIHHDVKPANVLFPRPDAPLTDITLIDFDVATQLGAPLRDLAHAPREVAASLIVDVHGFGELLFEVATGREVPPEGVPDPQTGNGVFDALVVTCLTSEAGRQGYTSLIDERLGRDLEHAAVEERARSRPLSAFSPKRMSRRQLYVAALGVMLFAGLVMAVVARVLFP
jgi:hypothetical protein